MDFEIGTGRDDVVTTSPTGALGTRVAESLRNRGVLGTVLGGFRAALHPVLGDQRVINYRERRFDRRFGVTTAGIIPHDELKVSGPSAAHAVHYQAAQPVLVEQSIARLKIDYPKYTFVDYGCGKGKALLLASSFPFARIVGIELSPELAEIAAANVRKYRSRKQRCRAIETICGDAVEFELPPTPVVCFLYNPFGEAVLEKVLDNFERSLSAHPRDLIVIYIHPELERVLRARSFLVNVRSREWGCVYRSSSAAESFASARS